jgi:predicted ferric reductase
MGSRARRPATRTGPIVLTREQVELVKRRRVANRRGRERNADILVGAFWTSVSASVALWIAAGGIWHVPDAGGAVLAVGIVCGLVATDLLLVMLVLAARVPFIDRAVGQDRAIAFHRRLGKPAFGLVLVHVVCVIAAYALIEPTDPVAETVRLATSSPELAAAFGGLAALAVVVGTSVVAAVRRRFAYEAWYLTHLLAYAGVLLAVPHQLTDGDVLALGTPERLYWALLYAFAFGCIVLFRVVVPLVRTVRHGLRVSWVEQVAPDAVSIHMVGRDVQALRASGGQYATWRFWTWRTWWHAHPVSFSAVPTESIVRITVRTLGAGTQRLARLRPGTFVSMAGPYGVFTERSRSAPYLAIVAAGIGITGARSLLEDSSLRPGEAWVVLRASEERQRYLWTEVVDLVRERGATLFTMTGHRPTGVPTWMSASAVDNGLDLARLFPRLHQSDLYVCGAPAWSDLVIAEAERLGVPRRRIHVERFGA